MRELIRKLMHYYQFSSSNLVSSLQSKSPSETRSQGSRGKRAPFSCLPATPCPPTLRSPNAFQSSGSLPSCPSFIAFTILCRALISFLKFSPILLVKILSQEFSWSYSWRVLWTVSRLCDGARAHVLKVRTRWISAFIVFVRDVRGGASLFVVALCRSFVSLKIGGFFYCGGEFACWNVDFRG